MPQNTFVQYVRKHNSALFVKLTVKKQLSHSIDITERP